MQHLNVQLLDVYVCVCSGSAVMIVLMISAGCAVRAKQLHDDNNDDVYEQLASLAKKHHPRRDTRERLFITHETTFQSHRVLVSNIRLLCALS